MPPSGLIAATEMLNESPKRAGRVLLQQPRILHFARDHRIMRETPTLVKNHAIRKRLDNRAINLGGA
jgi:hypothetical protein